MPHPGTRDRPPNAAAEEYFNEIKPRNGRRGCPFCQGLEAIAQRGWVAFSFFLVVKVKPHTKPGEVKKRCYVGISVEREKQRPVLGERGGGGGRGREIQEKTSEVERIDRDRDRDKNMVSIIIGISTHVKCLCS